MSAERPGAPERAAASAEPRLEHGFVSDELRDEFPQLALVYTLVEARARRSPAEVRARLRAASDRFTGARAVALRQQPIPWAYRVFFRHIGIDPDEQRTPVEAIALERLRAGGFLTRNLVDDALLLAMVDTNVALQAFDADACEGQLGLRPAGPAEHLGGAETAPLVPRRLVIADQNVPVAVLFGDVSERHGVSSATRRVLICALQVRGVPEVSVEEALWTAWDILQEAR